MINKQKEEIIQGQLSIFDIEIKEVEKPKEYIPQKRKESKNKGESFSNIINLYKASAARIVKQVCGALLVELEDRTLYFNSEGVNELELKKDMELLPGDEILVVNQDREANKLQFEKLEDMHVEQYIKRKGDDNIIIPFPGKTVAINPRGWILEYLQKPIYHKDELFNTEMQESLKFEIGDRVEFDYDGPQVGKISRIYNNGETVNVVWAGKHTAFYYKCVKKSR